jgi:excisionase family DNA binding protein
VPNHNPPQAENLGAGNSSLQKILVSKRDAAAVLSVSVRTVENLISSKELPARKIGRCTRIPYRALIEFARHDHPTNGEGRQ